MSELSDAEVDAFLAEAYCSERGVAVQEVCASCKLCGFLVPKWLLEAKRGYCVNCDVMRYCCEVDGGDWPALEAGLKAHTHCWECYGRLVPIGTSRSNGLGHPDWPTRKYHKKCWLERKRDGREGE